MHLHWLRAVKPGTLTDDAPISTGISHVLISRGCGYSDPFCPFIIIQDTRTGERIRILFSPDLKEAEYEKDLNQPMICQLKFKF